jgi:hypothetical protein
MSPHFSRSTFEAYLSIGVAIITLIFEMNFWIKLALCGVFLFCVIDVIFRWDRTRGLSLPAKAVLAVAAACASICLFWNPLATQLRKDRAPMIIELPTATTTFRPPVKEPNIPVQNTVIAKCVITGGNKNTNKC